MRTLVSLWTPFKDSGCYRGVVYDYLVLATDFNIEHPETPILLYGLAFQTILIASSCFPPYLKLIHLLNNYAEVSFYIKSVYHKVRGLCDESPVLQITLTKRVHATVHIDINCIKANLQLRITPETL